MAVLVCCGLLVLALDVEQAAARLAPWKDRGAVLVVLAGGVLVANLVSAVLLVRGGWLRRNLSLTNEDGASTISIEALEAILLDLLSAEPDVHEPVVRLNVEGEGLPLDCQLHFALKRQADVTGRIDTLKAAVRDAFLETIPQGVGIEITATVPDLLDPRSPVEAAPPPAEPAPREFTGPVYPTGSPVVEEEPT